MRSDGAHEDDDETSDAGSGLSIGDMLSIVLRHLLLVIVLTVVLGAMAAGFSLTLPNRYEAIAVVQLDPRVKKVTNIEGVLSDLKADNATVESEVEIIRSRTIALRVIETLKLRADNELTGTGGWRGWLVKLGLRSAPARPGGRASETRSPASEPRWPFAVDDGQIGADPERDEVAMAFEERLKAARVRNSLLIEIRFASADPVKAARIANAVAAAYIRSQIEAKTKATEAASDMLDDKLKGLREKVADAERRIEHFKAENNMFDADGRPLDAAQLQREMELLTQARTRAAEARAKYEQARRMMLDGESQETMGDVMQSLTIRRLQEEYSRAARRQAELSTRYGPRHPEMEKVVADTAKAQAELSGEVNKIIRSLRTEHQLALERERQQEARVQSLKIQITETKDKQWKLRELERDAAAGKSLYEAILQRNKQTEETAGLQLPDARIVTEADVPLNPAGPKRTLIALGGLGAGLGLGLALAFLLELGAGGLGRPEDIERGLKAEHLASIPVIRRKSDGKGDGLQSMRIMIAAPDGAFAEAIRALSHSLEHGRTPRSRGAVLVTSAQAGEGKTVVAANLALHCALSGRRTLLIDGDLRQRDLTGNLRLADQPGLMDVLAGAAPDAAILKDRTSGLHVLPASGLTRPGLSANEALSGSRMQGLIARLKASYDVIVLDSPPLLPVVDARMLSRTADQIVLIAGWRKTPVVVLRRAVKLLGGDAAKLAGIVLNRVDPGVHASHVGLYPERRLPASVHELRKRVA